ncbi:Cof-type HAD-IIB family hydrolase [Metabacillus sp. RGM 3146]|uniref:Cof-type HAD-IIB family hydrolase n=1 Tax=Metabacillus sp. RGM 3146 TaxID=3401092 RepID=UPI003B99B322
MVYRMLALNVDGTLLRSNGRLHQATKEAIDYCLKKGIYVTLVTNRHFQSARKLGRALKLNAIYVTHGGAFVSSTIDKPLYENRLSEDTTFNLVQVLENYDCHIRIIHERYSLGNRKKITENLSGSASMHTSEPLFYPVQYVESLGDALMDEPVTAPKMDVIFSDREEQQAAEHTIRNAFEGVTVLQSSPVKLELVSKGVSKEQGLFVLSNHLGIKAEEIVAIGDAHDDINMILEAGLGVAMGNAPFEVKKAADWVTRSNDESGIAYVIKEHFRKQHRLGFLDKINVD